MAIEKHLKDGEQFLKHGKLDDALVQFDLVLKENPESFKANFEKSIVLQRQKKYDDAFRFLKRAENSAKKRTAGKDLISKVLFRYCTLFYNRGEYENAFKSLNSAEKLGHDNREIQLWKTQLNSRLKKLSDVKLNVNATWEDVFKLPEFVKDEEPIPAPQPASTTKTTSETKEEPKEPTKKDDTAALKKELEEKMANKDNLYPKPNNIRKDWFQSSDQISVSFFIKNLPKDESLKVKFKKDSIEIEFPTSATSEFQYTIGPLFAAIDTKASSYKVFSTKLELYLAKASPNLKWKTLERSETDPLADQKLANRSESETHSSDASSALQYPNSSKSKTDWSKISISDDEEEENEGGNENAFFQQLYKGADEDTKRAMMKSFVESNGTALSTNWEEVSKTKFDTTPPDGLEARKWWFLLVIMVLNTPVCTVYYTI